MSGMNGTRDDALQLRDIFVRNIDDKIGGVIKVDDSNLADEVNEYVLTNEIQENLERFLDTYNDPGANYTNGVWISGFFGSGKSHLLKILSHVLGDVPEPSIAEGKEPPSRMQVIDVMKAKARDAGNHSLEGLLASNAHIPATSLLFNIDSKGQKGSRTVLMDAFIRVFDEARGYYGANKYVAKMERDLDANGCLDEFKRQFELIAGKPWSKGRTQAAFSGAKIDKAFAAATGDGITNILKDYQTQYNPTIADFADDVNDWLQWQHDGRRLIFLVDEVGQFIGSDTNLMLNLQTVTEELFSRTNGRVWVIVTSQEDIDAVIGDRSVSQGLDFTKIKGRFAVNLKLSSADAIEVIQKRLLTKNERGGEAMIGLWREHHDELDALFTLQGAGGGSRKFNDLRFGLEEDFTATYPFVNYQFRLFQEAMRGMSAAGFFEGQHRSVGERSLLATVSSALVDRKGEPIGNLIPFSALYDGISGTIQSSVNHRIIEATRELAPETQTLALPLLKALLLVKKVEDFKANVRNLRILILDRFGEDLPGLERRIQETLDVLERQNYVHRTGDEYEYLTNDERAVEHEIKNIDIDDRRLRDRLGKIIGGDILGQPLTVEYGDGKRKVKFHYGLTIDGVAQGRTYPITLHVVTPMVGMPEDIKILQSSEARGAIRVILGGDGSTFMRDLQMAERTETYLRLHANEQGARKRILEAKRDARDLMLHELGLTVAEALRSAVVAYDGATVEVKKRESAQGVVKSALHTLIGRLYVNFGMVEQLAYTERDLPDVLANVSVRTSTDAVGELDGVKTAKDRLDAPAQDVFDYVAEQVKRHLAPTVKDVVAHYEDAPYGWPLADVLACLCHLYGGERIRLTVDSARLPRTDAVAYLTNQKKRESIRVDIPKRYDSAKLRKLSGFVNEYLELTGDRIPKDAEELSKVIKGGLSGKLRELEDMQARNGRFRFVAALDEPLRRLRTVAGKPDEWILERFPSSDEDCGTDALLYDKDEVIDLIRKVLNGAQGRMLSDGLSWLESNEPNFTLASAELQRERDEALATVNDPQLFKNNKVNLFRNQLSELQRHLGELIDTERARSLEVVEAVRANLTGMESYRDAREDAQQEAMRALDDAAADIEKETYIAGMRQTANTVRNDLYLKLVNRLDAAKKLPETQNPTGSTANDVRQHDDASVSDAGPKHVPETEHADSVVEDRNIHVPAPHPKPILCTEDDVDEYLDAYRRDLMAAIRAGKRIVL